MARAPSAASACRRPTTTTGRRTVAGTSLIVTSPSVTARHPARRAFSSPASSVPTPRLTNSRLVTSSGRPRPARSCPHDDRSRRPMWRGSTRVGITSAAALIGLATSTRTQVSRRGRRCRRVHAEQRASPPNRRVRAKQASPGTKQRRAVPAICRDRPSNAPRSSASAPRFVSGRPYPPRSHCPGPRPSPTPSACAARGRSPRSGASRPARAAP